MARLGAPVSTAALTPFFSAQEAGGPAPSAACFAAAGPVVVERCAFSNPKWVIDAAAARKQLRTPAVRVVNDFEAVGYGIAALDPSAVLTLNAGQPMCVCFCFFDMRCALLIPNNPALSLV